MNHTLIYLVLISTSLSSICQVPEIIKEGEYKTICSKEYITKEGRVSYVNREKEFSCHVGNSYYDYLCEEIVKISGNKEDTISRVVFGTNNESTKHLRPKVVVFDLCVDTLTETIYKITSVDGRPMITSYNKKEQTPDTLSNYYKFYRIYADAKVFGLADKTLDPLEQYHFTSIQSTIINNCIVIELSTDTHKATVSYDLVKGVFEILHNEDITPIHTDSIEYDTKQ